METVAGGSHKHTMMNSVALQYVAAACAFSSQAIHLWVLPGELMLSLLPGLFFFAAAVGQGLLGVTLLFRPGKWAFRLGILLNSTLIGTLIIMHIISLPNLTGAPDHSIGILEVIAGFSEVILIAILVKLYPKRR